MTITLPTSGGFGIVDITLPGPWRSFQEADAANKARGRELGGTAAYWGKPEIKFFDSKPIRAMVHGRFVVDSRQFHNGAFHGPREWHICIVADNGEVDKLAFPPANWDGNRRQMGTPDWDQEFPTAHLARIALNRLIKTLSSKGET